MKRLGINTGRTMIVVQIHTIHITSRERNVNCCVHYLRGLAVIWLVQESPCFFVLSEELQDPNFSGSVSFSQVVDDFHVALPQSLVESSASCNLKTPS